MRCGIVAGWYCFALYSTVLYCVARFAGCAMLVCRGNCLGAQLNGIVRQCSALLWHALERCDWHCTERARCRMHGMYHGHDTRCMDDTVALTGTGAAGRNEGQVSRGQGRVSKTERDSNWPVRGIFGATDRHPSSAINQSVNGRPEGLVTTDPLPPHPLARLPVAHWAASRRGRGRVCRFCFF